MAHRNARLTVYGRRLIVQGVRVEGMPVAHVATAMGISRQCAHGPSWIPLASWRSCSSWSRVPMERCTSPDGEKVHASQPLNRTRLPLPPGPVLVPS
jgi:hypothetical protein